MSYSAASFKALAGVVLKTTPQYHIGMTFNKVIELVVQASRKGVTDENGETVYHYIAPSRHTCNYRVLKCRIHNTPDRWLEVTDYPNGGHVGLEGQRYANPSAGDDERMHHDKKSGAWWSEHRPKGW